MVDKDNYGNTNGGNDKDNYGNNNDGNGNDNNNYDSNTVVTNNNRSTKHNNNSNNDYADITLATNNTDVNNNQNEKPTKKCTTNPSHTQKQKFDSSDENSGDNSSLGGKKQRNYIKNKGDKKKSPGKKAN